MFEAKKMSRTFRKTNGAHKNGLRYPHTFNEIKGIDAILNDEEIYDYPISGLNHMRKREKNLPTAWDDNIVSAFWENDHKIN